jgi:putative oxidoreductase
MDLDELRDEWTPRVLSILRIMAGLLLWQSGLQKLVGFLNPGAPMPAMGTLIWFAGVIETTLPPLLILGLFTRPVAFILSGHLAFVYWIGHAPKGFYPYVNGGSIAVLYCFVFLYLAFAGGGPWSLDNVLRRRSATA